MATPHPNTGAAARECSRLAYGPAGVAGRIVAPRGPVSVAIETGRGEAIDMERNRLRRLAGRIRARLDHDAARIDRCLAAATARASLQEDGGCA